MKDRLDVLRHWEDYKRHLGGGGAPFGGEFNASIREVCEGYQEVVRDLHYQLAGAVEDLREAARVLGGAAERYRAPELRSVADRITTTYGGQ